MIPDPSVPGFPHRAVQAVRRRRRSEAAEAEARKPVSVAGAPGHGLVQLGILRKSFLALVLVPVLGVLVVRHPLGEFRKAFMNPRWESNP